MGGKRKVIRVATQGRADGPNWVETYDLKCTTNGFYWFFIAENVTGNTDSNTVVEFELPRPVKCRAVRFYPKTWEGNYPAMRADAIYEYY